MKRIWEEMGSLDVASQDKIKITKRQKIKFLLLNSNEPKLQAIDSYSEEEEQYIAIQDS